MNEISTQLTPCPHMKRALERIAQGKRGGPYLWYARLHTIKCKQCSAALRSLKQYFGHMQNSVAKQEIDIDRLRRSLESLDK